MIVLQCQSATVSYTPQRVHSCGWVFLTEMSRMKSVTCHMRQSSQQCVDEIPHTPQGQLHSIHTHHRVSWTLYTHHRVSWNLYTHHRVSCTLYMPTTLYTVGVKTWASLFDCKLANLNYLGSPILVGCLKVYCCTFLGSPTLVGTALSFTAVFCSSHFSQKWRRGRPSNLYARFGRR